jgi:hypothetical protein
VWSRFIAMCARSPAIQTAKGEKIDGEKPKWIKQFAES